MTDSRIQNIKSPYLTIEEGSAPATPDAGTQRVFVDTSDGHVKVKDDGGTVRDLEDALAGAGSDTTAIHDNESGEINALTEKTTLHANDLFIIEDSEASNVKKKVKKSNVGSSSTGIDYPDTVPTSPHAKDDEFNSSSLDAKWTVFNSANIPTRDYNTTVPSHAYFIHVGDGVDKGGGIYQTTPPSGDFTVTAKVSVFTLGTNYHRCSGIFFGDGTPGNLRAVGIGYEGSFRIEVCSLNSAGALTAHHLTPGWGMPHAYLRIRKVSTTWYFDYSANGIGWIQAGSIASAFTINAIGLTHNIFHSNALKPRMMTDWFRVTEP